MTGSTPKSTDDEHFTAERIIEFYREQIKYLQAENERLHLMVDIHYSPAEQIDGVAIEWSVTDDNNDRVIHETLDDANSDLSSCQEWGSFGSRIQYRFATSWEDYK